MAITHQTPARNAAADAVVDLIDAGAGAGRVQITKTAGNYGAAEIIADIALSDPAFGAAAAGVASASGLPVEDTAANNTGTCVEFRVIDSDLNEIFRGTVTTTGGGGDMEMPSTSVTVGEPVRITSFTYTAPV